MPTNTLNLIKKRTSIADNIAQDIRKGIREGVYPIGSPLVGRHQMAARYGVGPMAVQQAINILKAEGVVRTENGRGTYIQGLPADEEIVARSQNPDRIVGGALPSLASAVTIGVVVRAWPDPGNVHADDLWPMTIQRAFEWKMSSMPGVRLRSVPLPRFVDYERVADYDVDMVKRLVDEGCDGIALINPHVGTVRKAVETGEGADVPVVAVCIAERSTDRVPLVYYDIAYSGYQAGRHLIESGYEAISYFCPFASDTWIGDRFRGLSEAIEGCGAEYREIALGDDLPPAAECVQSEYAYEQAMALTDSQIKNVGIVAVNDWAGHGLLRAASERGLKAGRDFGLVGFDDLSHTRELDMTSLHPPLDAMGGEAAKLLVEYITGNRTAVEISLRSYLLARGSTKRAL